MLILMLILLAHAVASMNKANASAMLCITNILRLGEAPHLPVPLDDDSRDRMMVCLQVLAHPEEEEVKVCVLVGAHWCDYMQGGGLSTDEHIGSTCMKNAPDGPQVSAAAP